MGRIELGSWPHADHWLAAAHTERSFWAAARIVPCYGGPQGGVKGTVAGPTPRALCPHQRNCMTTQPEARRAATMVRSVCALA